MQRGQWTPRESILCGVTCDSCACKQLHCGESWSHLRDYPLPPPLPPSPSLLSPASFSPAHLDHLTSISRLPATLSQSARLANVASRDEMELQERRILRPVSWKMQMSTGERRRDKYAGKFDCDILFLYASHWQIRR